jgi:hypothetical protein
MVPGIVTVFGSGVFWAATGKLASDQQINSRTDSADKKRRGQTGSHIVVLYR